MDTEKFIQQDSEKKMADFRKAYGTDFDTHHTERKSEDKLVKEFPYIKVLFDKMHYKPIVGQRKEEYIRYMKWERFPIMALKDIDDNLIEVDDIVIVHWYGKRQQTEIAIDMVYVIKDNQIIHNYTTIP